MINKVIQMANERMHICIECPIYNSTTRTCGTPLNKLNPFAKSVTLDGVTFKPCGCFLDIKTRMTFSDCPGKRWPKVVDDELLEQAKALIAEVKSTNVLSDSNRKLLRQLDSLMKGTNTQVTSCIPCINKMISELENQLKREEVLLSEEQPTQKKKRGRKPRKSEL